MPVTAYTRRDPEVPAIDHGAGVVLQARQGAGITRTTPDAARASYEQLIKAYPDTTNAGLAKQALDRLGRQAATPTRP
jgi:hypothetical protein